MNEPNHPANTETIGTRAQADSPAALFASLEETFIPLRHFELIKQFQELYSFDETESREFHRLTDRLASIFHIEHLHQLMRIEELYVHLDPDADIWTTKKSEAQFEALSERFFDSLTSLLYNAHYQRLTREQVEEAVNIGSQWGVKLDVDYDLFEQIEVFVRGYRQVKITRRRWQNFFREETIELPEFRRLVLAFQLKRSVQNLGMLQTDCVYLKNFKDIPETDLEILLPGSKVRLSILDRGKILLPTVALTTYKIIRAAAVLTLATAAGIWGWVVLVGVLTAYVVKSVLGFIRTKDKYRFDLTQNLYLKNLDNNAGVLYRVFNEAEEQELCETILGYAILSKHGGTKGVTAAQLDDHAEAFLFELAGVRVDFDPHDSLAKLVRLGLAHVDSKGFWTATEIAKAPEILIEKWRRLLEIKQRNHFFS